MGRSPNITTWAYSSNGVRDSCHYNDYFLYASKDFTMILDNFEVLQRWKQIRPNSRLSASKTFSGESQITPVPKGKDLKKILQLKGIDWLHLLIKE